MREILFRGKRKDNGEWVEGDSLIHSMYKKGDVCIGVVEGLAIHGVIPETISEFTGLTDKNGKKVFEGDILQFSYTGKNLGVNGIAPVVFENGKFGVLWGWHKELVCLDGFANTVVEVVGNIHDNPELLGGE